MFALGNFFPMQAPRFYRARLPLTSAGPPWTEPACATCALVRVRLCFLSTVCWDTRFLGASLFLLSLPIPRCTLSIYWGPDFPTGRKDWTADFAPPPKAFSALLTRWGSPRSTFWARPTEARWP